MMRIATKYPRIAERHFEATGRQVEVIEVKGSVELAPLIGLADGIVDLVATGRTLEENDLEVREEIVECTARFVANRVAHKLRAAEVDELTAKLREASGAMRAQPLRVGGRRGDRGRRSARWARGVGAEPVDVERRSSARCIERRRRRPCCELTARFDATERAADSAAGRRRAELRAALAALDPELREALRGRRRERPRGRRGPARREPRDGRAAPGPDA